MTSADPQKVVAPGGTIGILGGGQLGRMTAMAAARLGYRCHIFCPERDGPAAQVAAAATTAAYDDRTALDGFAEAVDVVTYEFENIPASTVLHLMDRVPVRPGARPLHLAQNRVREKDFLNEIGVPTAPYRRIDGPETLATARNDLGIAAILKSTAFGYDGKNQVRLAQGDIDATAAWREMGGSEGILEGLVDFAMEISVITARGLNGTMVSYVPVENRHKAGILDITRAPADIDAETAADAVRMAERVALELDIVGLVAVEMFLTRDGRLLANEIAPRPHNSGHWTIDACVTSQFEQFVRAVAGVALGDPARHSDAEMVNLIGQDVALWADILGEPGAKLHLYGKAEPRPGRKMGHVTRLFPRRD